MVTVTYDALLRYEFTAAIMSRVVTSKYPMP